MSAADEDNLPFVSRAQLDEDEVEASFDQNSQDRSKHPVAALFHVIFKGAALGLYMFQSWIFNDFVMTFVLCTVLLSFDFWTVKNVTGRLMVGLRWWNEIKDDGSNEWKYEAHQSKRISSIDYRVFWGALYGFPIVWVCFGALALFSLNFQWLLVVGVALALTGANLIGYTKCSLSARNSSQSVTSSVTNAILPNVGLSMGAAALSRLGSFIPGSSDNQATAQQQNRNNVEFTHV